MHTFLRALVTTIALVTVSFTPLAALAQQAPVDPSPKPGSAISLTTSYVSPWRSLEAVYNQVTPASSTDTSGGAYGNWRGLAGFGETDWVSFNFDAAQTLGALEVYWWNNAAGILVPDNAIVEYRKDGAWVSLGNIGVSLDQYNRLEFAAISTTSLRVSMSSKLSTGILDARVFGASVAPPPEPEPPLDNLGNNIAATASLASSYVSPWRLLAQMTNGTSHSSSADRNGGAYGNWRGPEGFGETNWVSFSWDTPQILDGIDVYWWNNPESEILVPNMAAVDYWNGRDWVSLGDIGVAPDKYNRLELPGISTSSIRVSMSSDLSTGILEARVFGISAVIEIDEEDLGDGPLPPPPANPDPAPPESSGVNIAATATLRASYTSSWRRLSEMTNGSSPQNSQDRTGGAYGNWRGPAGFGQTDWVSFIWDTAQTLEGVEVYWWNNPAAEILVPNTAVVDYWDGIQWVGLGNIGVSLDQFNLLTFSPVSTTSIRISMSSDLATGILEARVLRSADANPVMPAKGVKWASRKVIYDGASSTVAWGDLDGDGDDDLFVAGGDIYHDGNPVLAWFEAPLFNRRDMGQAFEGFVGDSAIVDIDGDGDLDIAIPNDPLDRAVGNDSGAVYWLENGANWRRHTVDSNVANGRHYGDFRAMDMDGDGRMDLLSRHLDPFGFVVWFQDANDQWTLSRIPTRRREGLHVDDLDGDGLPDIVGNGFILFANNPRNGDYTEVVIDSTFFDQDGSTTFLNDSIKAGTADIDGDGKVDLVMSQAEGTDGLLAWYRSPARPRTDRWQRTVIESSIRSHQVMITDIDGDGDPDIAGAETWAPEGVFWWENVAGVFTRNVIDATGSCYNCAISDFDGDGDMDIAGPAAFNGPVRLYEGTGAN